ncbi:MAG: hypothetical protein ACK4ND_00005, partial [Cytophagaceae bacterium]
MKPPVITGGPEYEYRLFRGTGLNGNDYVQIYSTTDENDTVYVDLVNTVEQPYNYRIEYYQNSGEFKGRTELASSVFLSGEPGNNAVNISWVYNVPWENSGKFHAIYRSINGSAFEISDSLVVWGDSASFRDRNVLNNDTACYYIETRGEYCKENIPGFFINRSQEVCIIPRDSIPPCPPILDELQCAPVDVNYNNLQWTHTIREGCNPEAVGYMLYYSENEEEDMIQIGYTEDSYFRHIDTVSTAGCYAIKALNYYSLESEMSNKVCVDICVF